MEEKTILKSFPSSRVEALAMVYVQAQDLSGKTPVEIHELYWKAYREIANDSNARYDQLSKVE